MSPILQSKLPLLLSGIDLNKTTVTIFCPTDYSFFEFGGGGSSSLSLGLLEYHVVPRKVEKDLKSSIFAGSSKLDTLLRERPLLSLHFDTLLLSCLWFCVKWLFVTGLVGFIILKLMRSGEAAPPDLTNSNLNPNPSPNAGVRLALKVQFN
ncbi:hypothetical protein Sjap_018263 [Stephania japonica]|uniref:FAS1 domain-containing protein n=1 Tax=Stephania japonica TaxID=461633 RepID=A0AAP0I7N6_9MAGN